MSYSGKLICWECGKSCQRMKEDGRCPACWYPMLGREI